MVSRYFQVWNNADEKFVKTFCYSLILCNYFRFCFYFISKNGFTILQKVLLSVMSLILILLKKFFFSLLIKLTQRLRCLLLYMPFYRCHFLCLKIYFWDVTSSWSLYLPFYLWKALGLLAHAAFLWEHVIKSSFKLVKLKLVVLRSHLNNTIFNVKHKPFIRKVFLIPICFLFFIEYFHLC